MLTPHICMCSGCGGCLCGLRVIKLGRGRRCACVSSSAPTLNAWQRPAWSFHAEHGGGGGGGILGQSTTIGCSRWGFPAPGEMSRWHLAKRQPKAEDTAGFLCSFFIFLISQFIFWLLDETTQWLSGGVLTPSAEKGEGLVFGKNRTPCSHSSPCWGMIGQLAIFTYLSLWTSTHAMNKKTIA